MPKVAKDPAGASVAPKDLKAVQVVLRPSVDVPIVDRIKAEVAGVGMNGSAAVRWALACAAACLDAGVRPDELAAILAKRRKGGGT